MYFLALLNLYKEKHIELARGEKTKTTRNIPMIATSNCVLTVWMLEHFLLDFYILETDKTCFDSSITFECCDWFYLKLLLTVSKREQANLSLSIYIDYNLN